VQANDALLSELKETLRLYLDAVGRQQEQNPPDLISIWEKLDSIRDQFDSSAPAKLKHYLFTRSYRKAWDFLNQEGRRAGEDG
jgi:hypothetical protein